MCPTALHCKSVLIHILSCVECSDQRMTRGFLSQFFCREKKMSSTGIVISTKYFKG